MTYQPPIGSRDLYPLDVAQKQWIEERLQSVFQSWGYHRIITPTLERLDTLMAGGAIQQSTVVQLHDADNEVLGLRPELTASIARATATRIHGVSLPQRLYYAANVFRRPSRQHHQRQQEFYQAGVELLGCGGVIADAEIVLLVADCMGALQLSDCHLVIGEAELTRSLIAVFPDEWREHIRTAIAQLDRVTLETLPITPELRDRAIWLLELRGNPTEVLSRVSAIHLNDQQRTIVNNLKSLVDLLQNSFAYANCMQSVVLDLSLIQTFDYYTGIVFDVISSSSRGHQVLGQGGRYDHLLELYSPEAAYPGIGFSLNIEDIQHALLPTNSLPENPPVSDWLIVPDGPQSITAALNYANQLRIDHPMKRIELYPYETRTQEQVNTYAAHRKIKAIAWVQPNGNVTKEPTCSKDPLE